MFIMMVVEAEASRMLIFASISVISILWSFEVVREKGDDWGMMMFVAGWGYAMAVRKMLDIVLKSGIFVVIWNLLKLKNGC